MTNASRTSISPSLACQKSTRLARTRLALAEEVLANGAAPRALLKPLGLHSACLDALKFDPDQPRVPAGNGRESARWTSAENASDMDGPLQTGRSVSAGGEEKLFISILHRSSMILEFDKGREQMVNSFVLNWTELWVRTRNLSKLGEATFTSGAALLVGERNCLDLRGASRVLGLELINSFALTLR